MVDKKDNFDEEFDFDEDFPSFDDFDDDDADSGGAFDFADSSDEPEAEEITPAESDETYQFEETAEPDDFEEIAEKPKNSLVDQALAFVNQLRQKDAKKFYTYAAASFFILVMMMFFIIKSFSSAPAPTKTATKSKATKTAAQKTVSPEQFTDLSGAKTVESQPQTQTEPQTLAAPVVNPPTVSTSADSDTTKMLTTLQQQNQQLTQQIQALQTQLTQATSNYSDLQQQIQTNQDRVTNIEKTVNNVESQMSKVSNALQAIVSAATGDGSAMPTQAYQQPRQGTRTVYQAPPSSSRGNSYFIQAIIPGRAWLEDSSGKTITVTYGDAVPGLGKVTKIDPENGIVVTSAGVKIMYGINES